MHSRAGTVFSVQLSQEHSAARPAESSKAVLFSPSHITCCLRLFSSLARELAMKLIYLFFLCVLLIPPCCCPDHGQLSHNSPSCHTSAFLLPIFHVCISYVNKLSGIWKSVQCLHIILYLWLLVTDAKLLRVTLTAILSYLQVQKFTVSLYIDKHSARMCPWLAVTLISHHGTNKLTQLSNLFSLVSMLLQKCTETLLHHRICLDTFKAVIMQLLPRLSQ